MIFFSHIPKTAGTTLNFLLRRYFGSEMIAVRTKRGADYCAKTFARDRWIYRQPKCVSGHPVKAYQDFGDDEQRIRWMTFVRDPLKRYLSQYIHQQTGRHEYHKLDLSEWATRFDRQNWLVRWIAGEANVQRAIDIAEDKIAFVGDVETFDQSLILMKHQLGLTGFDLRYSNRLMESRGGHIKEEVMENYDRVKPILESENELDVEFYHYLRENLFVRQVSDFGGPEKLERQCLNLQHENLAYLQSEHPGNVPGFHRKDRFVYRPFAALFHS